MLPYPCGSFKPLCCSTLGPAFSEVQGAHPVDQNIIQSLYALAFDLGVALLFAFVGFRSSKVKPNVFRSFLVSRVEVVKLVDQWGHDLLRLTHSHCYLYRDLSLKIYTFRGKPLNAVKSESTPKSPRSPKIKILKLLKP